MFWQVHLFQDATGQLAGSGQAYSRSQLRPQSAGAVKVLISIALTIVAAVSCGSTPASSSQLHSGMPLASLSSLPSFCRALQADPFAAVFHDRIKMSTGGHRLKIEQKFQLLAPGVTPVKHYSIW